MRVFDLLALLDNGVVPSKCKIHLATWNGTDDPLEVYRAGQFNEWQRRQSKRNFERPFVLSLIAMQATGQWLFAGVHRSGEPTWDEQNHWFHYPLVEIEACSPINGRLVAEFSRPGRQSYLRAERWSEGITVAELRRRRLSLEPFPGYRSVALSKSQLDQAAFRRIVAVRPLQRRRHLPGLRHTIRAAVRW